MIYLLIADLVMLLWLLPSNGVISNNVGNFEQKTQPILKQITSEEKVLN